MPKFRPVRPWRISEEVTDQLKQAILVGHFKAGDKLPSERDLAGEFQVSRVAVREALRALENSGFIITRQGATGGAYVTELSFEHLANAFLDLFLAERISIPELYQVRLLVEPEVVRLAATRVTPEYAQQLREALEAEELPVKSLEEDLVRKTAVHYILAEMCGNRFFEALVRSLLGVTKLLVQAVEPEPWTMHPAGMHRPIVDAVLAGKPAVAAAAMKRHAKEFGKTLLKMEDVFREKQSSRALS